ncbi:MAG: asparagine synthase-related protein [Steroidobacteraceae bacterium]
MNLPYVAVLWNPLDTAQSQDAARANLSLQATNWIPTLQIDGLTVHTRRSMAPYLCAYVLPGGRGLVLGVLFDRSRNRRVSPDELRADPQLSAGDPGTLRHLTQAFWGGYIALLSNSRAGVFYVLRDCSGMLPCYYTSTRGITLVSSDARNLLVPCRAAYGQSFAHTFNINWRYIAAFLTHSRIQIRETGLDGVHELLAGEILIGRDERLSVELAWSPTEFTDCDPSKSPDDRCEELRSTVQSCIDAWCSVHDRVVHSLSGGFDSSLVLAVMSRSPHRPHIVCVNRYADGPAEDERRYARIAARSANVSLLERPWSFDHFALDDSCVALPLGAKPSIPALFAPPEVAFFRTLCAAQRFDAVWTGEGGDHLFMAVRTTLAIADFGHSRCSHRGLLRILTETSRLTGQSIPHLACGLLSLRRQSPVADYVRALPNNPLLATRSRRTTEQQRYLLHPWQTAMRNTPPGKRQHVSMLADAIHRLRPLEGNPDSVELQPLLSQPIIEQCLSIPTFELLCDGCTRGLARRAFSSVVPPAILNREQKGQTTHHIFGVLERSLPYLSDILVNGELDARGLLNSSLLKRLMTTQIPITEMRLAPLLACIAGEIWVRAWQEADRLPHPDGR